jgi:hypothetical protein
LYLLRIWIKKSCPETNHLYNSFGATISVQGSDEGISGKGIINYLPRLSELFTDLQRVNINSGGGEILYRHTLKKFEPEGRRPDELSRPDVSGRVVHSNKGADAEAEE